MKITWKTCKISIYGYIFSLNNKNLVIIKLIIALAKTNSGIGILPPIAFTQTLIRLKANPLPIRNLIPIRCFCIFESSKCSFSLNF